MKQSLHNYFSTGKCHSQTGGAFLPLSHLYTDVTKVTIYMRTDVAADLGRHPIGFRCLKNSVFMEMKVRGFFLALIRFRTYKMI